MINKVILIGRVGQDPEIRNVGESCVARLSVATSETYTKNGERKQKTEWHNVVAWSKLAEIVDQYIVKGRLVYVEGKLTTRSWEDKEGVKRYTTEIVAQSIRSLDFKKENEVPQSGSSNYNPFDDFESDDFPPF